jgi:hypothetical protein
VSAQGCASLIPSAELPAAVNQRESYEPSGTETVELAEDLLGAEPSSYMAEIARVRSVLLI